MASPTEDEGRRFESCRRRLGRKKKKRTGDARHGLTLRHGMKGGGGRLKPGPVMPCAFIPGCY